MRLESPLHLDSVCHAAKFSLASRPLCPVPVPLSFLAQWCSHGVGEGEWAGSSSAVTKTEAQREKTPRQESRLPVTCPAERDTTRRLPLERLSLISPLLSPDSHSQGRLMTYIHTLSWVFHLRATCVCMWRGQGRSGVSVIVSGGRKITQAAIFQGTSLAASRAKITALLPGSHPGKITSPDLFLQRIYVCSQLVWQLKCHHSWLCYPWSIQGLCSTHPRVPHSLPLLHPRNWHNFFGHPKP